MQHPLSCTCVTDLDLFVGKAQFFPNPTNELWLNDGSGNFTLASNGPTSTILYTTTAVFGDIDGDGGAQGYVSGTFG